MNEFAVIYEFSPYRFFGFPIPVGEVIALLIMYHILFQREPRPPLWAWIFPVIGIAFMARMTWGLIELHAHVIDVVQSDRAKVVEGEVTDVQRISNGGDQMFAVNGVVFAEMSMKPGFDANEQWGYRLRNGLYARVRYFDIPSTSSKLGWLEFKTCGMRIVTKFELRRTPAPRTNVVLAPAHRYDNCDL